MDINAAANITLPAFTIKALDALESYGAEAWVVGGMVRDSIISRTIYDADIACSLPWEETVQALSCNGYRCYETGVKFGTVTAVIDDHPIEITAFRTDGEYLDSRHPNSVLRAASIEEDLARRDFTINAMAYHPAKGLLDPYGGLKDLESGLLRAVGDPRQRMQEDALRILRGIRFCAQLPLSIEEKTLEAMECNAALLTRISAQRIAAEMDKLLCGPYAGAAIMQHINLLGWAIPEILPMKDCQQYSKYHIYDVLEHTCHVIDNVPAIRLDRWAALLHDIGKPAVRRIDKLGRGHFLGHQQAGETLARTVLTRLHMPKKLIWQVCALIRLHDEYPEATNANVQIILGQLNGDAELARALFRLMKADSLAKNAQYTEHLAIAEKMPGILDHILTAGLPYMQGHLAITGADLIREGMEPGPAIGITLEFLLGKVIEGSIGNDYDSLIRAAKSSSMFSA